MEKTDLCVRGIQDDDVTLLARFPRIECVDLSSGHKVIPQRVTAKGFGTLARQDLRALTQVLVSNSDLIDDDAVKAIASIPGIELLVLRECGPFGVEGVSAIARMPRLKWLDVRGCNGVTDDCIAALKQLRKLDKGGLRLTATGLSEQGLKSIRDAVGVDVVDSDIERWRHDR